MGVKNMKNLMRVILIGVQRKVNRSGLSLKNRRIGTLINCLNGQNNKISEKIIREISKEAIEIFPIRDFKIDEIKILEVGDHKSSSIETSDPIEIKEIREIGRINRIETLNPTEIR